MYEDKVEFGDFQTPQQLTDEICKLVSDLKPKGLIEPTCGTGNFLFSALNNFKGIKKAICLDINDQYIKQVKLKLKNSKHREKVKVYREDYFKFDWEKVVKDTPEPVLIVGNLPWVSNSKLSILESSNLPRKGNFHKRKGIEAITGKSNFDISEWILIDMVKWLQKKDGYLVMLCKTSVARKLLEFIWTNNFRVNNTSIYPIDAKKHFGVSVDACLFKCEFTSNLKSYSCDFFNSISSHSKKYEIGFADGQIVANINDYLKLKYLSGNDNYKWRSGIKHDNSRVMELTKLNDNTYVNGLGETIELEDNYLYPLVKSSDLANGSKPRKWVIVTQHQVGQNTSDIENKAPKTWKYLIKHKQLFDKRKSSIYKNKPSFSIFGVGDYTFKPYRIAISGLYKQLNFKLLNVYEGKPIMLDDTSYFLSFDKEKEAQKIHKALSSQKVNTFYGSMIFWDNKRPITANVLEKLNIEQLLI